MLIPIQVIRNSYTWGTELVPSFIDGVRSKILSDCQADAGSPSLSDILETLNFICQSVSHCARLVRISCKIRQSIGDSIFLYKTHSSAKRRTYDLILSGRSFIKMRNKTGPKTDPRVTPDGNGTGSEA